MQINDSIIMRTQGNTLRNSFTNGTFITVLGSKQMMLMNCEKGMPREHAFLQHFPPKCVTVSGRSFSNHVAFKDTQSSPGCLFIKSVGMQQKWLHQFHARRLGEEENTKGIDTIGKGFVSLIRLTTGYLPRRQKWYLAGKTIRLQKSFQRRILGMKNLDTMSVSFGTK